MTGLQPGHVKGDKLQCVFNIYQHLYWVIAQEI